MSHRQYEDGEYEQREYANKLLADEFGEMTKEEIEDELDFFERERERRKKRKDMHT